MGPLTNIFQSLLRKLQSYFMGFNFFLFGNFLKHEETTA